MQKQPVVVDSHLICNFNLKRTIIDSPLFNNPTLGYYLNWLANQGVNTPFLSD